LRPFSNKTIGLVDYKSSAAERMQEAIILQSAMLAKILKIMESIRSSFSKSLMASINCSGLALPPMSKKFAGDPP
jgi:hypothetical protein